jgi:ABC-type transport system substrate-binding protein
MSSTATATAVSKVVRIGVLSAIGKLDPRDAVDDISGMVLSQVFETPYTLAAGEGQVRPGLFQLLRSEGRLQSSAAIREGAKFSDGTLLTADLAARSLRGSKALHSKATVDTRNGLGNVWWGWLPPTFARLPVLSAVRFVCADVYVFPASCARRCPTPAVLGLLESPTVPDAVRKCT